MAQHDITITRSGELMVCELQGETPAGVALIDRWTEPDLHVVDAGRIILPAVSMLAFAQQARTEGLTIDYQKVD